jgi:carbon monoxide dehydrogenase subunit G
MKVALEKVFPMAAPADRAWQLLQDIEAVAGCMPGAKITERVDETHYKGTITVRLGPATMAFKGTIEVLALDAATRSLHLAGKGADATGTSGASMDLTAGVQGAGDAADACELSGKSEVTMSGKAAAFGARLMGTVAEQLLKQFAANFAAQLDARAAAAASTSPGTEAAASTGAASQAAACSSCEAAEAAMAASAAPPRNELNGLALAWAVLRDWVRSLFSRKAA